MRALLLPVPFLLIPASIIASILYTLFYSVYMPPLTHIQQIHLNYTHTTPYMYTKVPTLRKKQKYQFVVEITTPTTVHNQKRGNINLQMIVYSQNNHMIAQHVQTLIAPQKSYIMNLATTLLWLPLLVVGFAEEKRKDIYRMIELTEDTYAIEKSQNVYISLSDPEYYTYQVLFKVHAQFTGLRYLMYYWFISTAVAFVSVLAFWLFIILVSAYLWIYNSLTATPSMKRSISALPSRSLSDERGRHRMTNRAKRFKTKASKGQSEASEWEDFLVTSDRRDDTTDGSLRYATDDDRIFSTTMFDARQNGDADERWEDASVTSEPEIKTEVTRASDQSAL